MRGVGQPIWHVAGQEPARMMNGSSCVHSDVTDINLHVDYISRLQYTLPLKKPSGRFSILHHTNTSYIPSSQSSEGDGGSSQVVFFSLF